MTKEDHGQSEPLSLIGRIAAGVRQRHWGTIFIELLLIVAGILIALSIDGWVQDREDRKTERTYLGVLSRDLDQITEQLQAYMEFESANADAAAQVVHTLDSGRLEGRGNVLREHFSNMGSRRTLRLVSAAYTDLTSTGSLRLIRSRSLRDQLLRYFAEVARVELVIEKNNTVFVDELYFPFTLQAGISWWPSFLSSLDRNISEAEKDMLERLGLDFFMPQDRVFSQPPDAEVWDRVRRMTLMRLRVSTVGLALTRTLIRQTADLKVSIEEELAAR